MAPGDGAQGGGSPRRRISTSDSQPLLAAGKTPPQGATNLTRTQSAAARDAEKLREKASRLVKPFLVPQIVSNCCDHLDQFGERVLVRVAHSYSSVFRRQTRWLRRVESLHSTRVVDAGNNQVGLFRVAGSKKRVKEVCVVRYGDDCCECLSRCAFASGGEMGKQEG